MAINDRITIYELKLAEQMCQMDGKSSVPSELALFDITNLVVNLDLEPFVGLYFNIYHSAWKLDTLRTFQHYVAIKALCPAFEALNNAHEQQDFEDVHKLNFVLLDIQLWCFLFTFDIVAPQVSNKVGRIET